MDSQPGTSPADAGDIRGLAHGIVAGCPEKFNLPVASPFKQINKLLHGSADVVVNAATPSLARRTFFSAALSPLVPAVWYSTCQKHIPYSSQRMSARKIMVDALEQLSYDELADENESEVEFQRRVWAMLTGMRGDQKWYSLRFGAWLLTYVFQWLFNGEVYVKPQACETLRQLAPNSTFVYVPTHKSHLDYHMLSFVLFSQGLACPHIASGDNLDLPIVGSIMRTCGAFFIRRAVKGCPDAALYKATLDSYMHTLIQHGISTEFFIEGGRARDGRIAAPKLGLLAACVDASLAGLDSKKALFVVPTTITYDVPFEEAGLIRELLGEKKKKESVWQFISAFGKLVATLLVRAIVPTCSRRLGAGGCNGRAAVAFAEPVPIGKFLRERARKRRRRGSKKAGLTAAASAGDLSFDELIEQARSDSLHATSKPSSRNGSTSGVLPSNSTSTPAALLDTPEALTEAFPRASDARRAAVSALGHELHTRMLHVNVIPSSALLAASLLPSAVVGHESPSEMLASAEAGGQQAGAQQGGQARRREQSVRPPAPAFHSVPEPLVLRRYAWCHRVLAARGASCMPLPLAPIDPTDPSVFILELAKACAPHITSCSPATPTRKVAAIPAGSHLSLVPSPASIVWQHTRLNYLLPFLAPPALIACALNICMPDSPNADGFVDAPLLEDATLWLRRLLAPDLNDALGVEGFASRAAIHAELSRLSAEGAIMQRSSDSAAAAAGNGSDSHLQYAAANGGPAGAGGAAPVGLLSFSLAALAPLVCTYATVLQQALVLLRDGGMTGSQLVAQVLASLREWAADATCAVGPVPSQLVVQHAVHAWERSGLLTTGSSRMLHVGSAVSTASFVEEAGELSPTKPKSGAGAQNGAGKASGAAGQVKGGIAPCRDDTLVLSAQAPDAGRAALVSLKRCMHTVAPIDSE